MVELRFKWDEKDLQIFQTYSTQFGFALDEAIKKAGYLVRNTAIDKISHGSRKGRLYKRGKILHRASAVGEFPKTDTGRLVNSIRVDHSYLKVEVGSDVSYAGILETKDALKGGRPWLEPSYMLNKDKIETLFSDVLRRTFKQ